MFFLLFLLDDRRIRIRIHTSDWWIRIQEAQKHVDPVDPDPQHWFTCSNIPPVLEFQVSVLRKNSVLRIRIRDPVPFWLLIRDLGWVKSKDPDPEWKIRIRAPDGKSRIRYKHPGSATLKNWKEFTYIVCITWNSEPWTDPYFVGLEMFTPGSVLYDVNIFYF